MKGYDKNISMPQTFLSVLSAAIVLILVCTLIVPLTVINDPAPFHQISGEIVPEHRFAAYGGAPYKNEIMALALSDKALNLVSPDNIDSITLSYKESGEWVEITDENNKKLPADASYQLKIEYDHITADQLLASDCQMVYERLPDWFSPNDTGALLYGEEKVADIEVKDGRIIVTFDREWLEAQGTNNLHGSFKINGEIKWKSLPADGEPAPPLPGLNVGLEFEDDLASKYGDLSVEKSEPELVKYGDSYYLRYEIKISSAEADTIIPGVYINDTFISNTGYIEGYVGVTADLTEPVELYPRESSTEELTDGLKLGMNGSSMKWDIGDLMPNETRTLIYYAKVNPSYINSVLSSPFKNMAEVFSGENLKGTDSSIYSPNNSVNLSKEMISSSLDSTGTGTLTYRVTLSAPETNSYTLENLTLSDSFPEYLKDFLTISSMTVNGEEIAAGGSSFSLQGISLAPGDTITVEYTVDAEYIFASGNGDVEFNNVASVRTGDGRTLRSVTNNKTYRQNSWLRKISGDPLKKAVTINIPPEDSVFGPDKNPLENSGDIRFTIEKNSLRYQVVVNEDGRWDLSSATMEDEFTDEYMRYCGYIQISAYKKPAAGTDELVDDDELIERLENESADKTVWLKADSLDSFAFTPAELGLPDGEYTYLLTYYARPEGVDNVGSFAAENSFGISGRVGFGNGKYIPIPGMKLTVSSVMQGGIAYDIEKMGWYYEPSPVYKTDGDEYPEFETDYTNGALYWVIRLSGDIRDGSAEGSGRGTSLSGFIINDNPSDSQFRRDSLVGMYVASKDICFDDHSSYADFIAEAPYIKKLDGNPRNDKWFKSFFKECYGSSAKAVYEWYADDGGLNGIIFPEGYDLSDDEAIYIILRTVPNSAPKSTTTYQNDIGVKDDSQSDFVTVDTAELTVTQSLYKESKGAYIYNAETGELTRCSTSYTGYGDDWKPTSLDWNYIKANCGSGTYAPWLVNVNYNGSMQGTADVSDILPEGMELAYCDILWIGNSARNPSPKCIEIPELDNDSDWIKLVKNAPDNSFGNAVTYYNPATGELRWRISDLTKWANHPGGVGREINLRVVCKVTDHDFLLRRGEKTYVNNAYSGDEVAMASVTISRDGSMNKQIVTGALENDSSGLLTNSSQNRLPFSIEINPLGEDLWEGDRLPALIDKLSRGLVLIEDSLNIIDKNGDPVKGYSYTVQEDADGSQTIIISDLPDNTALTIYYDIRISAKPGERVDGISNNAYWQGYPSDTPQIENKSFRYEVNGDVFSSGKIGITITKVDSVNHSRKLEGAEFEIYEVGSDGKLITPAKVTGSTDSKGSLVFIEGENELFCNKVYCIIETSAPSGYKIDRTPHYFAVVSDPDGFKPNADIADLVDIWYDSPDYSYTMPNHKGDISVNKIFRDINGEEYTPDSGSYSFGLFETQNAKNPIEILRIEYTNGTPRYYLNGSEIDKPCFSDFEPDMTYYVYELDSDGNPIKDSEISKMYGIPYLVEYFDDKGGSDSRVTVNGTITVMNSVVDTSVDLPTTGGEGLRKYHLTGAILLITSLLFLAFAKYYSYLQKRRKHNI